MSLESVSSGKRFLADLALVIFPLFVNRLFVPLKIVFGGESRFTLQAFVVSLVGFQVAFQILLGAVRQLADWTLVSQFLTIHAGNGETVKATLCIDKLITLIE